MDMDLSWQVNGTVKEKLGKNGRGRNELEFMARKIRK